MKKKDLHHLVQPLRCPSFSLFVLLAGFVLTTLYSAPVAGLYVDGALAEPELLRHATVNGDPDTYQLFTHGRPGQLLIAGQWLDAPALGAWLNNGRLDGKEQLLIYGCHFGQGETGRAAVAYLERTLGIPVAASDDLTGVDGDWDLELGRVQHNYDLRLYPYNLQDPCGVDVHIANDNSGSVDAEENRQSREFVSQLGFAFDPLGTSNVESRISISTWSWLNFFEEYNFPLAGQNYTTTLADVLSYQYSARTQFDGKTDIYKALLNARAWVNQNPVVGRSTPKVIVLLTDASCFQVADGIDLLATQLKNQGVYIVLLAIDEAASCPALQGTNVASPGGYFAAGDYQTLEDNVLTYIDDIRNTACTNAVIPPYDLTVSLSDFEITNCSPGPAAASADYTVTNVSTGDAFNDVLQLSFYNGDPTLPGTQFLFTENLGTQNIASDGTFNGTVSDPSLLTNATLYAVVNYDGSQAGNEPPIFYAHLRNQLVAAGEGQVHNNFSAVVTRTEGAGCLPNANIDVQVDGSGTGCDAQALYTVQICNTGTADAVVPATDITNYAPAGFNLVETQLVGEDPFAVRFIQLGSNVYPGTNTSGGENFPVAISPNGSIIAVGESDASSGRGSVHSYEFDGTDWLSLGTVTAPFAGDELGSSVALSSDGSRLVSGMEDVDRVRTYARSGSMYNTSGSDLATGDTDFGQAVALSNDGNVMVVGAPNFQSSFNPFTSRVKVYTRSGSSWTQRGQTLAFAAESGDGNWGYSVDISADGNTVVACSYPNPNDGASDRWSRAVVYDWNGSSWVQRGAIIYGNIHHVSLSADGSTFATSAYPVISGAAPSQQDPVGASKVYEWNGSAWVQKGANFPSSASNDLSSDGDLVVFVGGGLRVYEWDGSSWKQGPTVATNGLPNRRSSYSCCSNSSGRASRNESTNLVSLTPDGSRVVIAERDNADQALLGRVRVFEVYRDILPAGECATFQYLYEASGAGAGTYDYSVDVAATALPGDDPVTYTPDTNFSEGGDTGLNGFDGGANTSDDVTYGGSSPACPAGDQVTVSVSMTGDGTCQDEFGTATVTIDNQTGLSMSNLLLTLDLTGTGAIFNGEPYNRTNGLVLAEPNVFDPAYPNVPNALSEQSGMQELDIYTLPAGVSTFDLTYIIGSTVTGLSAEVSNLLSTFNATGAASASQSITPASAPVITGTCPADVTSVETTLALNYTLTNATIAQWSSSTGGTFVDPTSATTTYTINDKDRANGYVDFSLQAISPDGCDAQIICRVNITGTIFDYGDAPATYDLNEDMVVTAAGATTSADIFLGQVGPDTESMTQASANAQGDGADEDGLLFGALDPPTPGQTNYAVPIEVTNTSGADAYVYGYIDWNEDGDFVGDPLERSLLLTVPPGGVSTPDLLFDVPASFTREGFFIRLRISSDAAAVANPYGPSIEGEVEDHTLNLRGLAVVKTGTFNDEDGNGFAEVGETISYTFTVTNTGSVPLTNITISDPLVPVMGGPIASLAPGASDASTFTATYTLIQADLDATEVVNQATVTGTDPSGDPVTDLSDDDSIGEDDPTVVETISFNPGIAVIKTGVFNDENGDTYAQVGESITYSFTVTNTGDIDLTNVTVTDMLVPVMGGPIALLAPGASDASTFTATYVLTLADVQNGSVQNQAIATGDDPNGDPVTDDSDDDSLLEDEPTVVMLTPDPCDAVASGNPDFDGDGVADLCDLDDDNDGIYDQQEGGTVLLNPNPSSPNYINTSGSTNNPRLNTFPGWTGVQAQNIYVGMLFDQPTAIVGVTTQGGTLFSFWTTSYRLEATKDGSTWVSLGVYPGNFDNNTQVFRSVNNPDTDWVGLRISPVTWSNFPYLRFQFTLATDRDLDGDGSFDRIDFDSDGDGCFDVVESGGTDANDDGVLDGTGIDSDGLVTGGTGGYDGANGTEYNAIQATVTSLPMNQTVGAGTPVSFTIGVTADEATSYNAGTPVYGTPGNADGGLQYQWYLGDPDAGGMALTDGGVYSGTTASTLNISNSVGLDGNQYYVVATHSELACFQEVASASFDFPPEEISVVKTATFNDEDGDTYAQVGETITYSFTVTNTGAADLTNVTIMDPLVPVMGGTIPSLASGESDATTFTATYVLTLADVLSGSVQNQATATGTTPGGDTVTDLSDDDSTLEDEPTIVTITLDPCDPIISGNPDFDGDGVSDICDLDDDNDGILDTEEDSEELLIDPQPGSSNYVTSGDHPTFNQPQLNSSLAWLPASGTPAGTGFVGMLLDEPSEIVGVTTRGWRDNFYTRTYRVEATKDGTTWVSLGDYTGNINGTSAVYNAVPNTDNNWIGVRIVPLVGNLGGTYLRCRFTVQPALDVDLDGFNNSMDLDSDGDGCFDVVESGGVDANDDGILDGTGIDADGLVTGGTGGYDGANGTEYASDVISSVTIAPAPAETCAGEDLTLTATPTGVRVTDFGTTGSTADDTTIPIPAGDYSYRWFLGASTTPLSDGAPYGGTTTASLTITDVPAGFDGNQYRVEVTALNNSCPEEALTTLVVGVAPTADAGAAAGAVCADDAYTAAATATGGTILWTTSGDGSFVDATVEDAVYTPGSGDIAAGTVNLTMTVTGCVSTTASDMVMLTINPLPATPAITGDTDPLCLNETRILTTTASGTIVWSSSDPSVATVDPNTGEVTPVAVGSVDITYVVTDANGCSATSGAFPLTITDVGCAGQLEIRVMLQGALLGSPDALMRDDLRSGGYIPLSEPYGGSGNPRFAAHGSGGGETTTSGVLAANAGTPDAIVDWVLVELRDAATPATILETRAALLQRDGDVVDPTDGVSPLVIDGTTGISYYVSVKHRNHLGVMTATPRAFIVGATTTVDFITATAAEVFDVSGGVGYDGFERILISGQQALWAGNANADDQVKYQGPGNDAGNILFEVLFFPTNTGFVYNFNNTFGYFDGDINMDGQVKYQGPANDPSFVFFNLIFNYSGLNTSNLYNYDFLTEQLP